MREGLEVDRWGVIRHLLLCAVVAAAGVVILRLKGITVTTSALCLSPILLFAAIRQLRLLAGGLAIEFSGDGFIDHTSGLGFIRWSELASAHRKSYGVGNFVELRFKEPDVFLAKLPWLKAQLWRFNMSQGFRGPAITANWVAGGPDAVLAAINAKVSANGN